MDNFWDNAANFLKNHPVAIGVLIALIGLFLFFGSVFNCNWLFGNISAVNYSTGKIDGLVNLFGQKTARIIFGAVSFFVFIAGITVIWLSLKT